MILMIVGVACGGDDTSSESTDDSADTEAAEDAGSSSGLVAANFAFDPTSLTAAAGDSIDFTNEDDASHSFTVDDADIDVEVDAGSSGTIDLADVDPGSYDFYCKFHKDSMTGTLEVTE